MEANRDKGSRSGEGSGDSVGGLALGESGSLDKWLISSLGTSFFDPVCGDETLEDFVGDKISVK